MHAFPAEQQAHPREEARHGVIHAQLTRPDQLAQMAALDVSPSFFIGHTFYINHCTTKGINTAVRIPVRLMANAENAPMVSLI